MKLVIGLGNPGARYEGTRHNVGCMVADQLLAKSEVPSTFRSRFDGLLARVRLEGSDALLLEPQTYMNRSGQSVVQAARYFRVQPEDMLVIHDEVDLPFGTVRVKRGGGSGGHRGLESCFDELESRDFDRVRVGIGGSELDEELTDYVLRCFDDDERGMLEDVLRQAANAALTTVTEGATAAMNRFNRRAANGGEA